MKLSKAQIKLMRLFPLRKVRWAGPDGLSFFKDKFIVGVNISTYTALKRKGFIAEGRTDRAYPAEWSVELTPAGRQALLEAEGAGESEVKNGDK